MIEECVYYSDYGLFVGVGVGLRVLLVDLYSVFGFYIIGVRVFFCGNVNGILGIIFWCKRLFYILKIYYIFVVFTFLNVILVVLF